MHSHLMDFLESKKILSNQHGTRGGGGGGGGGNPVTPNSFLQFMNRRQQINAISLDFSKAFDKVHQHLAAKLHHYGIRHKTPHWSVMTHSEFVKLVHIQL